MLTVLILALTAATAASASPTGALQRREDQVIAGQLYPESCMSDCQPWLDLQLPCTDAEDQKACMCVRENTLALYSCSACVVNAQGYDKTVADTMYSIVRVHDSTCDARSSSLYPPSSTVPFVVGGTTYLQIQPSDVTGGLQDFPRPTLYWQVNGTFGQGNVGVVWPSSAFSTVTVPSASATAIVPSSTPMPPSSAQETSAASASRSSSSSSATAVGLSASESASPANGASTSKSSTLLGVLTVIVTAGVAALG